MHISTAIKTTHTHIHMYACTCMHVHAGVPALVGVHVTNNHIVVPLVEGQ